MRLADRFVAIDFVTDAVPRRRARLRVEVRMRVRRLLNSSGALVPGEEQKLARATFGETPDSRD
jgi:hypothetical protein